MEQYLRCRRLWLAGISMAIFSVLSCGYLGLNKPSTTLLPADALVINNGMVIDGISQIPIDDGLVAIREGILLAVGPKAAFEIPEGAQLLDAQGGTILPGFIDVHSHILGKYPEHADSLQMELAHWLKTGVTTLRDLGSHFGTSGKIHEIKMRLQGSGHTVPTVVLVGPFISNVGGFPPSSFPNVGWTKRAVDAGEARQVAIKMLDAGADGLKIFLESGSRSQPLPILTSAQVAAITQVAHDRDTWVSAHITHIADAQVAVSNGVDDLAHPPAGAVSDELIAQMIEEDVLLGTTLTTLDGWFLTSDIIGFTEKEHIQIQQQRQAYFRRFLDLGGRIALGTDYPYNLRPPGLPMEELQRMVDMGMTPMEVIIAATQHGAIACGLTEVIGTLQVGKQADVIVVAGNPLEDIGIFESVTIVIKGGEIIVKPEL